MEFSPEVAMQSISMAMTHTTAVLAECSPAGAVAAQQAVLGCPSQQQRQLHSHPWERDVSPRSNGCSDETSNNVSVSSGSQHFVAPARDESFLLASLPSNHKAHKNPLWGLSFYLGQMGGPHHYMQAKWLTVVRSKQASKLIDITAWMQRGCLSPAPKVQAEPVNNVGAPCGL
jgi:hypothetical protein